MLGNTGYLRLLGLLKLLLKLSISANSRFLVLLGLLRVLRLPLELVIAGNPVRRELLELLGCV